VTQFLPLPILSVGSQPRLGRYLIRIRIRIILFYYLFSSLLFYFISLLFFQVFYFLYFEARVVHMSSFLYVLLQASIWKLMNEWIIEILRDSILIELFQIFMCEAWSERVILLGVKAESECPCDAWSG